MFPRLIKNAPWSGKERLGKLDNRKTESHPNILFSKHGHRYGQTQLLKCGVGDTFLRSLRLSDEASSLQLSDLGDRKEAGSVLNSFFVFCLFN